MKFKKQISILMCVLMFFSLLPTKSMLADEIESGESMEGSLIAHYDMSQADGKLTDVTGNGLDAEYVGFEEDDFITEQDDTILNFTGDKSKYVKLPSGLIEDETFSIETTFSTSTNANHWLYTLGTKEAEYPNVNNYVFLNPKQGDGTVRFGIKDDADELLFQDATLQSGEYSTFTATFADGNISIYINGEPVGTLPHTYSVTDILSNGVDAEDFIGYIGRSLYTPDPAFTGQLADFKVYNYTLSEKEVRQNAGLSELTDEEIFQNAVDNLEIPNANDVRGNITLPTSNDDGVTFAWVSSEPSIVMDEATGPNGEIPAGVVIRQDSDTQVTVTATITYKDMSETKEIPLIVKAKAAEEEEDYDAYLMTHFTGESSNGEQIYFAGSEDGLNWEDLNQGSPVLTSDIGEKGVRDPYILRSPEGDKFYLIATDLRIASGKGWDVAQRSGSKSIIVWESTDLVNWSEPRKVEVGLPNAGCVWAPEAIYDEETGEYIVFFASRLVDENGDLSLQDVYYVKTRDFYTFTEPQIFIDRSDRHIIDTTIIEDDGMYYRYSADGQITIEKTDTLLGDWTEVGAFTWDEIRGNAVEGPLIFKFNDRDEWNLMVDQYSTGEGYLPLILSDLSVDEFEIASGSLGTNRKRHGSVLTVTQEEYEAIQAEWGELDTPNPVDPEQEEPILEYNFDKTSSEETIEDDSGNENDGTLNGNAAYVADEEKDSQVLYLDGTDNTFAAFPQGFFDGRDTVSISMDIKAETVSGNFFTFAIGKDSDRYMFLRTRDTEIRNAITENTWENEQEVKSSTSSIKDKWMNINLVITPTSMKMYKDGRLLDENNDVTTSMSDLGTDLLAYLGKSFYSADSYFEGYFDNVKVFNRALSEEEVQEMALPSTGIVSFEIPGQKGQTQYDSDENTISLGFKGKGTEVTNLTPTIDVLPGSTVNPASGEAQDFTNPVTYTVTDEEGNKQQWTVSVEMYPEGTLPGLYADPQIYVHGDTYYMYPTTDGFESWSGTQFKAFSSKDLINWEDHGVIVDLATDDVEWATGNAWAPGFAEKDGYFYHYSSANQQIGVTKSSSPTSGFEDPLGEPLIPRGQYSGQAIDPYVFTDDDGESYLYWGNGSLWGAKLNKDMISLAEEPENMTPANFREGAVVFKRNGTYYLMWSENDTRDEDYQVAYATGDSPYGPWKKHEVILSKDLDQGIKGPGHHSVLNVPNTDDYYIVYHRHAIPDGNGFNREVIIDEMNFNEDGTIKQVQPTLEGITEPVYIPGTEVDVTGVTVSQEDVTLTEGETTQFTANVTPENATNKNVIWTSNDENVAKVSDGGTVTAIEEGLTVITVTTEDGGFTATTEVTVQDQSNGEEPIEIIPGQDLQEVAAGKTYTISGTNAKITMPADLPVGTKLKVEIKDVEETNYDGLVPSGDNLTFTFEFPEGSKAPNSDFSLVMGYDEGGDAAGVAIYYYNEDTQTWEERGGNIDEENQTITIAVSHFSTYGVFVEAEQTPGEGGQDGEDGSDGSDGQDGKDGEDGADGENGQDGEDSQDNTDGEGVSAGKDNQNGDGTSGKDEKLPDTATNLFNYLLIGMILLAVSGLTVLYARKRKMNM
ncbi:family 43 glycosylhydrolase [Aquibacillus rhizosphaerae]|uniref:Family 43 glycosylhydrolase n=1 Tax=Aquibacillus rhizosphaerae TaxID=3051431 RepID=A0ABT7L0A3_9BACI|nr:family 43 glycosylhydrolase [Aquibacillus sp. LR5S19]MDL4839188.1 family 43 glycosylhydrolase [Aquibacillus sp. LR5S19]